MLIPLAKEVFSNYGGVNVPVAKLKQECHEKVIGQFGFKGVDYSLLQEDDLWYVRQLELADGAEKQRYLERLE